MGVTCKRDALDRYISEARQDPFELAIDDDRSVIVGFPPIDDLIAATESRTDDEQLRLLAGPQYVVLREVLGGESFLVLRAVLTDMAEHFRLAEVAQVTRLIGRYGDAIRADLRRVYGVDLLDFFRGDLSADAVLDYLEHLPRTSAYNEALAQDEELAERTANGPDRKPGPPPLTEWGPEVQALAEVRDLVAQLLAVTIKAHGGKPQKVQPYPRPVTAIERVRRKARLKAHRLLVARVLPGNRR